MAIARLLLPTKLTHGIVAFVGDHARLAISQALLPNG
jgi:hypothetical protein